MFLEIAIAAGDGNSKTVNTERGRITFTGRRKTAVDISV